MSNPDLFIVYLVRKISGEQLHWKEGWSLGHQEKREWMWLVGSQKPAALSNFGADGAEPNDANSAAAYWIGEVERWVEVHQTHLGLA